MADSLPKRLEIRLRRLVIRLLRRLTSRKAGPLGEMDLTHARFLFIRQDMIGDVLVSTGLFAAIKEKHPDSILDVVLSPKNLPALTNNPHIRRRWIYNKRLSASLQLIRDLRRERYDFAVDLMDNPSATSTVFSLLAGARWNVGLEKENAFAYDVVVPLLSRKERHIIDRLGQLLPPFGIDPATEELRPRFYPTPEATESARVWWEREGLADRMVLGINISAGTDVRFWGIENFRKLIGGLLKAHPGCVPLVLHKPSDTQRAMTISEPHADVRVSPPTPSFDHFAALVRKTQLLITPDTSAVHLASAFRIPCVALYVQSDPNLRIWDPYRTPHRTLVTPVDDLRSIPVEKVLEAVGSLVEETAQRMSRRI